MNDFTAGFMTCVALAVVFKIAKYKLMEFLKKDNKHLF